MSDEPPPPKAPARRLATEAYHHMKRAAGLTVAASELEASQIEKHCGALSTPAVFEFIVWRKSTLLLSAAFSLATVIFAFVALGNAVDKVDRLRESSGLTTNLTEYTASLAETTGANFSFPQYTLHVSTVALDSVRVEVERVGIILDCVIAALLLISWAVTCAAAHHWAVYARTRRLLLAAWLIAFAAPFVVSIVPASYFAQWGRFESAATDYILGFASYFNVDERAAQAVAACESVKETSASGASAAERLEDVRGAVSGICRFLRRIDGGAGNFFSGGRVRDARRMCQRLQTTVDSENLDTALRVALDACTEIEGRLAPTPTGALLELAASTVRRVKQEGALVLGLSQGLLAFRLMAPSAIAMGPGILQGSLRVKALVPQSSIPGMLVILLPWLYCPLAWAIYNTFSQAIGNVWLLAGLLILASGPLGYIMIGTKYNVPSPMTRERYASVKRLLDRWGLLVFSVAQAGIFLFMLQLIDTPDGAPKDRVKAVARSLVTPRALANLFVATMSKILLTRLAGVDLMVGHIARQREFEVQLAADDPTVLSVQSGAAFTTAEERRALASMMAQREAGLDDLRRITALAPLGRTWSWRSQRAASLLPGAGEKGSGGGVVALQGQPPPPPRRGNSGAVQGVVHRLNQRVSTQSEGGERVTERESTKRESAWAREGGQRRTTLGQATGLGTNAV